MVHTCGPTTGEAETGWGLQNNWHGPVSKLHAREQGTGSVCDSKPMVLNLPNVVSLNTVLQVVVTHNHKINSLFLITNFVKLTNFAAVKNCGVDN